MIIAQIDFGRVRVPMMLKLIPISTQIQKTRKTVHANQLTQGKFVPLSRRTFRMAILKIVAQATRSLHKVVTAALE